ncbi:MAG: hypothetical protein H6740_13475 [Alphaproteobacteria bacterium]|nr:hypothetical protein [Alphaproteobacteria bacterium]
MEADELQRLARLFKLGLGVNAGLALVNVTTLGLLFVFLVDEPAQVAGVDPLESQDAAVDQTDPREELRDFFDRTSDLLDRAARRNGTNPAEVLPTQDEINDAVETRTIHSDASQKVMQKLREGYDYYDLQWPLVVPQR